ncbi:putative RDD family membrane protein YckC [Halospina denitrificans]|uniref:Putative RDD family membrane protein YckC n=1 Tax=Halospina denitrificans TaxID=332522 RepID=A0A4R7JYN1_9GAMM|nr:RDD family protein [Halospina denitrificans]TDT43054.1 putative RDD family membrane protein YckC [Halospina denitrificans]
MSTRFEKSSELRPAPLLRRLAAMLYDGLLCIALLLVVTGLYTGLHKLLIHLELLGADRYAEMLEANTAISYDPVLTVLLVASLWGFFGFFWRRRGQTLGMQAWKIRIQNEDGSPITWLQAFMRVLVGILSWLALGLGYLWQWFDTGRRSWTDLASDSVTVLVSPRA